MKRSAVTALFVALLGGSVAAMAGQGLSFRNQQVDDRGDHNDRRHDGRRDHDNRKDWNRGHDRRDWDGGHDRRDWNRGHDRRDWNRHRDGRYDYSPPRRYDNPPRYYSPPRYYQPHHGWNGPRYHYGVYDRPTGYYSHRWIRGERLPRSYYGRPYVVSDYDRCGLRAPPYGHHWVRVDTDVVLAAITTGVILDVAYNHFY